MSVELPEAVLPADLEQRHHGSFLHGDTGSDQCGEATIAGSDLGRTQQREVQMEQSVAVPLGTVGRQYPVQDGSEKKNPKKPKQALTEVLWDLNPLCFVI